MVIVRKHLRRTKRKVAVIKRHLRKYKYATRRRNYGAIPNRSVNESSIKIGDKWFPISHPYSQRIIKESSKDLFQKFEKEIESSLQEKKREQFGLPAQSIDVDGSSAPIIMETDKLALVKFIGKMSMRPQFNYFEIRDNTGRTLWSSIKEEKESNKLPSQTIAEQKFKSMLNDK